MFEVRRHYVGHIEIPLDQMLEVESDFDIDRGYNGNYIARPRVVGATHSFKCRGYVAIEKPGPKLQALIDLGYTPTEGVKMLDALGEETE